MTENPHDRARQIMNRMQVAYECGDDEGWEEGLAELRNLHLVMECLEEEDGK